ncbi:hypothetical protein AB0J40_10495 [Amycolatopsis sp. NPDC049691]|uniref:hypothetical protein n=1 Tax=Amycolatopsis sp. NPDC049691 TaxID=3155155 RepID=UPI0034294356
MLGTILLIARARPDIDLWQQVRRWWPVGLILLGGAGLVSLLPAASAKRGPLVLIVLGAGSLVVTSGGFPEWLRGYIWPLSLIVLGVVVLVRRSGGEQPISQPTARMWLVAQSRTFPWPTTGPSVLIMRAVASGCVIRLDGSENRQVRLEITAVLTGVDIWVPKGWTVHSGPPGPGGRVRNLATEAGAPESANLQVIALSVLSGIEVKES